MRKFWFGCIFVLFTLGILTGCQEASQTSTDKPAASANDTGKATGRQKSPSPPRERAPNRTRLQGNERAASPWPVRRWPRANIRSDPRGSLLALRKFVLICANGSLHAAGGHLVCGEYPNLNQ